MSQKILFFFYSPPYYSCHPYTTHGGDTAVINKTTLISHKPLRIVRRYLIPDTRGDRKTQT